jgi:xanthine dehydrogenase accessory factor
MRELLRDLNRALDEGRDCVFCSVVETRGSTPQKAGASMLVFADGSQSGTLGGGCVEAEVRQRALRSLSEDGSAAHVLTFSLDDNYGWDDGLICGGRMTILADPLGVARRDEATRYYRRLQQLVEEGNGFTEVIVLADEAGRPPIGSRYLYDSSGQVLDRIAPEPPPPAFGQHLLSVQTRPRPYVVHGVAYLPIWPRITLLIVGGGHVGRAVAKLAAEVDFDVWVLDDREAFANAERFPMARRFLVGDIGEKLKELAPAIHPSLFAIIVTRGHAHDEEALYHLAHTPAGYLGMIGSKRKIKLIYQDLIARGIGEAALKRVHAPLGFDIGSQTVPEIAVSIVAELIANRNVGPTATRL